MQWLALLVFLRNEWFKVTRFFTKKFSYQHWACVELWKLCHLQCDNILTQNRYLRNRLNSFYAWFIHLLHIKMVLTEILIWIILNYIFFQESGSFLWRTKWQCKFLGVFCALNWAKICHKGRTVLSCQAEIGMMRRKK